MLIRSLLRFLLLSLLGLGHAWAAGMGVDDARHLLNRTGFGASPEEIVEFSKLTREQGISQVLAPVSAKPQVAVPADVSTYVPVSQIREMRKGDIEARRAVQRERLRRALLLKTWWVEEMLAADTPALQLRERMVLFWHNHFVSSITKVKSSSVMFEQNQLFRQYALGNFGQLLHAAAKNPAMVVYLDAATNRKGSPNENFAREVMELFTLGEGQYSEQDIKESARAYTGWSIDLETGAFKWRPAAHDDGQKTVLGQSGNFNGDAVLDILLAKPQTAEFIVAKLWREFVSSQPNPQEVQRIARQLRSANYDLRVAVGALLRSEAFWTAQNRGALIKSPVDLVIGTLHSFDLQNVDGLPFAYVLGQLGQDLFMPPNVKGWPGGDAWINSKTLLARKQFIERLLRSEDNMKPSRMRAAPSENLRQRARLALEDAHIDTRDWQRRVEAAGLRPEQVLLAVPGTSANAPANTANTSTGMKADTHNMVQQLLLDVTYQVR